MTQSLFGWLLHHINSLILRSTVLPTLFSRVCVSEFIDSSHFLSLFCIPGFHTECLLPDVVFPWIIRGIPKLPRWKIAAIVNILYWLMWSRGRNIFPRFLTYQQKFVSSSVLKLYAPFFIYCIVGVCCLWFFLLCLSCLTFSCSNEQLWNVALRYASSQFHVICGNDYFSFTECTKLQ